MTYFKRIFWILFIGLLSQISLAVNISSGQILAQTFKIQFPDNGQYSNFTTFDFTVSCPTCLTTDALYRDASSVYYGVKFYEPKTIQSGNVNLLFQLYNYGCVYRLPENTISFQLTPQNDFIMTPGSYKLQKDQFGCSSSPELMVMTTSSTDDPITLEVVEA